MVAQHFHYRHPLWGRGDWLNEPHKIKPTKNGVRWDHTSYYIWFMCLLRSTEYKIYCQTGRGPYSKTFDDFGDVFAYENDFKRWFNEGERGVRLFAEPFRAIKPMIVRREDPIDWDNPDIRIIQFDANRHKAYVLRKVAQLAGEACKEAQQARVVSRARVQFYTAPKDVDAYLRMLRVWDLKQAGVKTAEVHRLCYPQQGRQIEVRQKEAQARLRKRGEDELIDAAAAKLLLQKQRWQEVNRDYQKACKLIENAAKGIFPRVCTQLT